MKRLLLAFVFGCLLPPASPLHAAEEVTTQIRRTPELIEFRVGDEPVTVYRIDPKQAKPYFWPLAAPGGLPVTRTWPIKDEVQQTKDHVHHKSLWFCHGDVIPEGIELKQRIKGVEGVDFWSETPGHGKIVCVEVGEPQGDRVTTRNEWQTADGVKILDEVRTIRLQRTPEGNLLTLFIELKASVCPITFGDTKEGSLGVRVHDRLRVEGGTGVLRNAAGKEVTPQTYAKNKETAVWGLKSPWCDYRTLPGSPEPIGVAVFDHPRNPSPACWHARGYGLLAANPFGRDHSGFPDRKGSKELVKLKQGESLKLTYAILTYVGDAKVAAAYERFAKE